MIYQDLMTSQQQNCSLPNPSPSGSSILSDTTDTDVIDLNRW